MTVKQKQCLLAFLGFYAGSIDGIWGAQSQSAADRFLRAFGPTEDLEKALKHAVCYGMPEYETKDFWDEIEFFDREEFRCQCNGKYCDGFPVEPDEQMARTVNEIRRRLGVPVSIVTAGGSGVRCPVHNRNVGGVANSLHLYGKAADLHSGKSPQEMYRVAEEVLGNTGELGLYDWGIHVGVGTYNRFRG